jgi:hypothetical protein
MASSSSSSIGTRRSFVDLVGLTNRFAANHFLCDFVDVLLTQPVAGLFVNPIQADFLSSDVAG